MRILFFVFSILFLTTGSAQRVAINTDGSLADPSAILDVKSTTNGMLVPRMSSEARGAIVSPSKGLLVFDNNTATFWFYSGVNWVELRGVGTTNFWLPNPNGIYYNAARVGVGAVPHPIVPLTLFMPNTNNGNAVLHLKSNDTYHSALSIFNGNTGSETEYSFILAGPANRDIMPGSFGLLNHGPLTWSFNFHPATNYMAIGSAGSTANVAKSRVHVFNGDVNIDQIGSGLIMKSPNGNCWRITIDNTGNLVRTAIACP
jgi:hypothetical protein